MWPERQFTIDSQLSDEVLYGEMPLLNTALFNVLDNAQKYSLADTKVEVTGRRQDDVVVITVRNRTAGLSIVESESLFDKYRRGGSAHNTSGAGIGLWLVRQIIEQHQGRVQLITTQKDSKDTVTVTITLPVSKSEETVRDYLSEKVCGRSNT